MYAYVCVLYNVYAMYVHNIYVICACIHMGTHTHIWKGSKGEEGVGCLRCISCSSAKIPS